MMGKIIKLKEEKNAKWEKKDKERIRNKMNKKVRRINE